MRSLLASAVLGLCMAGAVGMAYGQAATGNTSSMKIALSNNYAGNSWRQTMLKSWAEVADPAVKSGVVAAAPTFTTAENQATEQAQQIQNLILQGYKAIVIDAASPTALNGVIKQACGAGVTVVTFDGIATEPCAYRIAVDFHKLGSMQVDYMAKRLNGKGNLLEIRGLAGVSVDDEIHRGIVDELKKYPGLKVVGSVHGDWTQTVAQKQVAGILPTLPKIDGVVAQGGDGYGAANAIKEAGRPTPIIILATARKNSPGGRRSARRATTTRFPSPFRRAARPSRSGWRNSCSRARSCRTTSRCRCSKCRPTSSTACSRRPRKAGSRTSSIRATKCSRWWTRSRLPAGVKRGAQCSSCAPRHRKTRRKTLQAAPRKTRHQGVGH